MAKVQITAEEEEVFHFLFDLQESGVTNMFDAPRWIMVDPRWHHIFKSQADAMVMKWMKNYKVLRRQLGYEKELILTTEEEEIFRFLFERSPVEDPDYMSNTGTKLIMNDKRWKHLAQEEAEAYFKKWCDNLIVLEKQLLG